MNDELSGANRNFYFDKKEGVSGSVTLLHRHDAFELYYMKDGKCTYFIEDRSFDAMSGDIILIPTGELHRTTYGTRPCTRLLINFPERAISPTILKEVKSLGYLYRNREVCSRVETIFDMMAQEYARNDFLTQHALRSYTEELLVLLIRYKNAKKQFNDTNTMVEDTIRYIQQNYMTDIRLTSVAKMMNVSPEHLSRSFKKKTTLGFNEYLTLYRLERAENILKNEPGRSIIDVAYSCGFNDSNYFSYKFKEHYGITPTKARSGAQPQLLQDK